MNDMDERQKRRALYRTWKKGYYHLCTDGRKDAYLFYDEAEYVNAINAISMLDLLYPVKVHIYEVMRNHLHLLISGKGIDCVAAFDYLKRRIGRRLRADGHPPLSKDYDFRLIPVISEEQMRQNFIYIARNASEVQNVLPGGYLWGSSMLFYSDVPRLFHIVRAGDMSIRTLRKMFGSRQAIPPDRPIHPGLGMALPQGFVDMAVFYKMFPTAKEYETRLVKDYEAFVDIADQAGEDIVFSEREAEDIVHQEMMLSGQTLDNLSSDERCRLAVRLHRKYRLKIPTLSHFLLIPERVLAQVLQSKRYTI